MMKGELYSKDASYDGTRMHCSFFCDADWIRYFRWLCAVQLGVCSDFWMQGINFMISFQRRNIAYCSLVPKIKIPIFPVFEFLELSCAFNLFLLIFHLINIDFFVRSSISSLYQSFQRAQLNFVAPTNLFLAVQHHIPQLLSYLFPSVQDFLAFDFRFWV